MHGQRHLRSAYALVTEGLVIMGSDHKKDKNEGKGGFESKRV